MRRATLAAMLMFTVQTASAQDHTRDTTDQVKKAIADKKAVLVDVREQKEWDAGTSRMRRCSRSRS